MQDVAPVPRLLKRDVGNVDNVVALHETHQFAGQFIGLSSDFLLDSYDAASRIRVEGGACLLDKTAT